MNRKNIIVKNVSLGLFYKILNMSAVYITVPILLNYLDKEHYGLWVTIFSIVNIVFYVDLGIGNGLKTKLTEAISSKDFKLAREYISTTYAFITGIALLLLIIGVIAVFLVDLKSLLNTSISEIELKQVFFATLLMIITSFVLSLYKTFYFAIQKSWKVELALVIYQLSILISIIVAVNFFQKSLLYVALIYGVSNIVVSSIFTIQFFKKNSNLRPSLQFFSRERIHNLMGLSLEFFFIQLCMIIIFTSDNIIISKLLGPSEVASYDVVYKLFQVAIIVSIIAQDPFWPLYTDAYQKKDFKWIKQTLIRLNKLFIPFIILVVILVMIAKPIISLWIQKELSIDFRLIVFMGIFVIIRVYGIIYMYFLNGIGKIRLQLILFIIGAVINIPLSIYFVKHLNLGSSGVILGTIVSILSMTLILPIQTFKILKKSEYS